MSKLTERQTIVLRYRRYGHSVPAIAEMLGVSTTVVNTALKSGYKNLHAHHEAEEAREVELSRLDEIQSAYYERAIGGVSITTEEGEVISMPADERAADVVFKAMDRRAKLMGLDAPEQKKVDSNITIGWENGDDIKVGPLPVEPPTIEGGVVEE